jgi:ParB family chromosome partitioning protein
MIHLTDNDEFDTDAELDGEYGEDGDDGEPTGVTVAGESFIAGTATARELKPRKTFRGRLGDVEIAPENVRYGEAADEDIPQLAETIAAAGVLQPLHVRKGRKGEAPLMALDGRRRILAMRLLKDQGRLNEDYGFDYLLAEGKDAQAAVAVLTNTETAPIHIADFIIAGARCSRRR